VVVDGIASLERSGLRAWGRSERPVDWCSPLVAADFCVSHRVAHRHVASKGYEKARINVLSTSQSGFSTGPTRRRSVVWARTGIA
jgi:hypothetical protein